MHGLSLLKVKESLIAIQMVQMLYTSANTLRVCIHKCHLKGIHVY